ncbi:hypothetical protein BDV34DRAFT_199053, partial [Aspergillus parasiticus]
MHVCICTGNDRYHVACFAFLLIKIRMGKLASYFMPKLVLSLIVTASIIIKDREYGESDRLFHGSDGPI